MSDGEKYTQFFIASLVFFETYQQLQNLWTEQATNRLAVGVTLAQEREMINACVRRRAEIERGPPTLI